MKIVATAEMRRLEQAAVEAGATWEGLMEHAGLGVAREALRYLGDPVGRRVLVLVGPGNNGGDGLVVARHLHDAGAVIALYLWRRQGVEHDANWQQCRQRGLIEHEAAHDPDLHWLTVALDRTDLVVDALLGMGASRHLDPRLAAIVARVNAVRRQASVKAGPHPLVVAVDLPTGVQADSGAILGTALYADLTVATGLPKPGLFAYPGRKYRGHLALAELEIPTHNLEALMSDLLTAAYARSLLPERPLDAHKGSFGNVMVVAGSLRYPGAAFLACAGAARVGAGLVTFASARTVLGMAARLPEVTVLPLAEGDWGALGPAALEEFGKEVTSYKALVLGPGLGQADSTRAFVERAFGLDTPKTKPRVGFFSSSAEEQPSTSSAVPSLPLTVLDADGLNLLATIDDWSERLPKEHFVFTPHPGEFRRLLKLESLPEDRLAVVREAAEHWGQVVVLKGATTLIAAPDGRTLVYDGANPALATAGTGDVLAGAIGGLLAQGLSLYDAAALGVYLHGAAGARVRDELGEMGTLAGDLLPELPRTIKDLRYAHG